MKVMKRCLTLFLALLLAMLPTLSVSAAMQDVEGDYIRYRVLSAADLLALMDGVTVSPEERSFLELYQDTEVVYNAAIPGEQISFFGLAVMAIPYETETLDGASVDWTVTGDVAMDDDRGVATATYRGTLSLSASDTNELRNFAWQQALLAEEGQTTIENYRSALAAYQAYPNLLAAYEQAERAYQAYVQAKTQYDADVILYAQNKAAWDAYDLEKAAYDQAYAVYETAKQEYDRLYGIYVSEKSAYDAAKNQYDADYIAYVSNYDLIRHSMEPMEAMFVEYGLWKGELYGMEDLPVGSLYQALQNEDLVTMLMRYKNALCTATGLTEQDFSQLKTCSDELNALLRQYAEKREISEKEAFEFYKQNHAEISQKFNYLYGAMTNVLRPSVYSLMCGYVDAEFGSEAPYKKWRIRNVLCQIYLFSKCLDDGASPDIQWSFYNDTGNPMNYPYNHCISAKQTLTDTNDFSPASLEWVNAPEEPILPIEPIKPTSPVVPISPFERLEEPTPPTVVTQPTPPNPVEEPTRPAQTVYDQVARCEGLLQAKQEGTLIQRSAVLQDQLLYVYETVQRRYDPVSLSWLESIYDETGALCESHEEVAASWEEAGGEYVLLGFQFGDGGLCHYPIYERKERTFTVIFCSEGRELSRELCGYGRLPTQPQTPTKERTDAYTYTFDGWQPAVSRVVGDVTYHAQFTSQERSYSITFEMKDLTVRQQVAWQQMPVPPTPTAQIREGIYLYRWTGWDQTVVPVTGAVTYRAVYEPIALVEIQSGSASDSLDAPTLVQNQNGYVVETDGSRWKIDAMVEFCAEAKKGLTFELTEHQSRVELNRQAVASLQSQGVAQVAYLSDSLNAGGGSSVAFYDADGTRIFPEGTVRLHLPVGEGNGRILLRRYEATGAVIDLEDYSPKDGAFVIDLVKDETYRVIRQYRLTVQGGENGTVTPGELWLEAGAPIALQIYPNQGYRLQGLTLRDASGQSVTELSSPEGLIMPAYDALLTVGFEEIWITVEFRYHGGSEKQTYRFGEKIIAPQILASFVEDGKFYSFIGWSKNPGIATEDTVYEAKYSIDAEEKATDVGVGSGAVVGIVRYWILPAAAIGLGVASVLTVGIVFLVKFLKKRKNRDK